MTFTTKQEERFCFAPCSEDKVKKGLCDCINRMKQVENQNNIKSNKL